MIFTCERCARHIHSGEKRPGENILCQCGANLVVPEPNRAAGAMNCPSCGAAVDPDASACPFCSSPLATILCPACFGMAFEGFKHCIHCGESLVGRMVLHPGDQTEHRCPRCDTQPQLQVELLDSCPFEKCPTCQGLWVDRETIAKIFKQRATAAAGVRGATGDGRGPQRQQITPEKVRYIKCPQCSQTMLRQNFSQYSGVIIDICRQHGTWFDADELRRILEYIDSGGLGWAHQRDLEAQRGKIDHLSSKLDQQRDQMSLLGGTRNSGRGSLFAGAVGKLFGFE